MSTAVQDSRTTSDAADAEPDARSVVLVSNHADIVGGGELSLLDLAGALDRRRWRPTVVVPAEGRVAERARALGVSVRIARLPSLRLPRPAMLSALVSMREAIRRTRAAVVHANGSRAMLYAGLAGRLERRPVIWHVRVADPDCVLDAVLLRLADGVIANSRAVAARFGASAKVRCIPNGIDLARFDACMPAPGLRRSLGVPDDVPVAVSVGRFVPYKGYAHLLEAAALVQRTAPDVHWILVGEGPLRSRLERRAAELGLAGRIHFTGWRDDVAALLAASVVFVLPSIAEHFGRVLVEAMAMRKPVVATAAGGVPEIVVDGETGLLVPPTDAGALAASVLALVTDAERARRLGDAGYRRAVQTFDLARHAEAVERLYLEVLERRGGRPGARGAS